MSKSVSIDVQGTACGDVDAGAAAAVKIEQVENGAHAESSAWFRGDDARAEAVNGGHDHGGAVRAQGGISDWWHGRPAHGNGKGAHHASTAASSWRMRFIVSGDTAPRNS